VPALDDEIRLVSFEEPAAVLVDDRAGEQQVREARPARRSSPEVAFVSA
jgi:hypothetical protein